MISVAERVIEGWATNFSERIVIFFSQGEIDAAVISNTRVGQAEEMETVYADKLYAFLTEIAVAAEAQGDQVAVRRIDVAKRHYMIPLTSEFLGESMVALREVLETSRWLFTPEQARQAKDYVDAIKQQWFSPR